MLRRCLEGSVAVENSENCNALILKNGCVTSVNYFPVLLVVVLNYVQQRLLQHTILSVLN